MLFGLTIVGTIHLHPKISVDKALFRFSYGKILNPHVSPAQLDVSAPDLALALSTLPSVSPSFALRAALAAAEVEDGGWWLMWEATSTAIPQPGLNRTIPYHTSCFSIC